MAQTINLTTNNQQITIVETRHGASFRFNKKTIIAVKPALQPKDSKIGNLISSFNVVWPGVTSHLFLEAAAGAIDSPKLLMLSGKTFRSNGKS
ncbi:hypothetical protein WA1_10600 [Scytonema hofmannii PCC 7110]|uniref:Uncharacterized protein n=1 Tax=Scytonema hofmannii PCC 7110 TaxID=128403 RepID=A0A139XFN4_9CYAN|nr:hypothetical protein [Scytonema hofmannii]KYC43504.1 hypothetical protein WA1_10600 [Scytonema hofmannii PCC 7110]